LARSAKTEKSAVDPAEEFPVGVDAELEGQGLEIFPRRNFDDAVLVDEDDLGHDAGD
jgi:hypothetical protein